VKLSPFAGRQGPLTNLEQRLAAALGMRSTICASCLQRTYYRCDEVPKVCGNLACGIKAKEPWAVEVTA